MTCPAVGDVRVVCYLWAISQDNFTFLLARSVPGGVVAGVGQDMPDAGIRHLMTSMGPRPECVHWSQAEGGKAGFC